MNLIIDAPATLKAFLAARARGADEAELEKLKRADDAARNTEPRAAKLRLVESDKDVTP